MEFTGERYIPTLADPEIGCEHWHRYLYASRFARDKVVLDIACGEGYGSRLLAQTARSVVGIDVSEESITYASRNHGAPNIEFRTGSASNIPIEGLARFDLVVSFETIEHLTEQDQETFLAEVKRLLAPTGLFIVSTPNKLLYSDIPGYRNPYHLREFYVEEFRAFLGRHFKQIRLLGQKLYAVSYIWDHDSTGEQTGTLAEFRLSLTEKGFSPTDQAKPVAYSVVVCSDHMLPDIGPSVLLDLSERLLHTGELATVIPPSTFFILVDEDQLRSKLATARYAIPFLERDGQYWGPPSDDETAIREHERLRRTGAAFIAFAWPAFWWLDYYRGFHQYLRSNFHCVLENDRLIVFDLRRQLQQ